MPGRRVRTGNKQRLLWRPRTRAWRPGNCGELHLEGQAALSSSLTAAGRGWPMAARAQACTQVFGAHRWQMVFRGNDKKGGVEINLQVSVFHGWVMVVHAPPRKGQAWRGPACSGPGTAHVPR